MGEGGENHKKEYDVITSTALAYFPLETHFKRVCVSVCFFFPWFDLNYEPVSAARPIQLPFHPKYKIWSRFLRKAQVPASFF